MRRFWTVVCARLSLLNRLDWMWIANRHHRHLFAIHGCWYLNGVGVTAATIYTNCSLVGTAGEAARALHARCTCSCTLAFTHPHYSYKSHVNFIRMWNLIQSSPNNIYPPCISACSCVWLHISEWIFPYKYLKLAVEQKMVVEEVSCWQDSANISWAYSPLSSTRFHLFNRQRLVWAHSFA